MNQFHIPSFGDEVFEMNDTPIEPTQNENASRRMSIHSTMDHVDNAEEEQMGYNTANLYGSNMVSTQQQMLPQPHQQQMQPQQPAQQALPQSQSQQAPAKPLAPFALFFRDTMTAIKQQNPACTREQTTAIVHNMWDTMDVDEKAAYDRRHEADKREYMRQLRDYQRNQQMQEQQVEQPPTESESVPVNDHAAGRSGTAETTDDTSAMEPVQAVQTEQNPDQVQLINELESVQKCTREFCNKPAIINPDWEDEYCSNDCVVIHCRNVFSEWVRTLAYSPP